MISWLMEVLTYGAIGALIGASWMSQHKRAGGAVRYPSRAPALPARNPTRTYTRSGAWALD